MTLFAALHRKAACLFPLEDGRRCCECDACQGVICDHDWRYDHEESQGPWTGYIERCSKCGAISQVPM